MLSSIGHLLARRFAERPILVVGVGRSGTSVVKRALGAHPEVVAGDGEAPFVATIASAALHFESEERGAYRRDALRTDLGYMRDALRRICFEAAMGPHHGLRRTLRESARARKSPLQLRRWCLKTFPTAEQASGLLSLYEEARFVYVFRNGCDVVHSRTRFASMRDRPFAEHCREWAEAEERYAYLLTVPESIAIRQEELLADPRATLGRVLEHLRLRGHRAPASLASSTLVHPLDEPTKTGVDVTDAVRAREPSWQNWTSEQRATFSEICRPAMERLGYDMPF